MNWYKAETGLKNHVKLVRLAKLLHIEEVTALGYIHYFLSFVAEYAETGRLNAFGKEEIEKFCRWNGPKGVFLDAFLKCRLIDKKKSGFIAHDFYDKNTRHLKEILRKREVRRLENAATPRRHRGDTAAPLRTNERTNEPYELTPAPAFESFWAQYPSRQGRKEGKVEASAEWIRINPDSELIETIMKAVKAIENQQYPLNAAKWLKEKRWLDEKVTFDDSHLPPHLRRRAV